MKKQVKRERRERGRKHDPTENMITDYCVLCPETGDDNNNAIEEANGRMAVGLGNQPEP